MDETVLIMLIVLPFIVFMFVLLPFSVYRINGCAIKKQNELLSQSIVVCEGAIVNCYLKQANPLKFIKTYAIIEFEANDGQRFTIESFFPIVFIFRAGDKGAISYRQYKDVKYFNNFKKSI